jgi:hypothetical protein
VAAPQAAAAAGAAAAAAAAAQGEASGSSHDPSKAKRRRSGDAAPALAALPAPPSPLLDLLGCQSLASHLLPFLLARDALRLGKTSKESRPLVDAAITHITLYARSLPPDPVAFAARFPLLGSLAFDIHSHYAYTPAVIGDFTRRLALETALPTRITRLAIIGTRRYRREVTNAVLDGLLAVDWPRLTHFETDDMAGVLSRVPAPALLTRLRTIGCYGHDENISCPEDLHALAAAFRDGAFPNPPAIPRIKYVINNNHHQQQGALDALGAILAATPAVAELVICLNNNDSANMTPVLQVMRPNHGSFQQLRCVPACVLDF